jgi:hypothetical protein
MVAPPSICSTPFAIKKSTSWQGSVVLNDAEDAKLRNENRAHA